MKIAKKINPIKAIKGIGKFIVKAIDAISYICPTLMLSDWRPEKASPYEYGMSVLLGLVVCACMLVGALLVLVAVCSIFIQYPIPSVSVVLVLAAFVGLGYARKKIGRV